MSATKTERIKVVIHSAVSVYIDAGERAAMRCALGDAATICDIVADEVRSRHTGKRGLTKQGRELSAVIKECADEIFKARDLIETRP